MRTDEVSLLRATADALCDLVCHVGTVNVSMENMAWLMLVCKFLPDTEQFFPHGKWATIQSMQEQLDHCAKASAQNIVSERRTAQMGLTL